MISWSYAKKLHDERLKARSIIDDLSMRLRKAEADAKAQSDRASMIANTLNRERFERSRAEGKYVGLE